MLRLSLGPLELFLKKGDATGEIWKKLKAETWAEGITKGQPLFKASLNNGTIESFNNTTVSLQSNLSCCDQFNVLCIFCESQNVFLQ